MPSFSEIAPAQLARLIGTPDTPIILDVRLAQDAADDPRLIPGARRASHDTVRADDYAGRSVVVVCHKGLKLSHGVAALLRASGVQAEALEGGHVAWAAADLPLIPMRALPPATNGATLWVARHRPKIDRIACPWLIRRFIDPAAKVLFVPPRDVTGVADRFGAVPFDVPDVTFTHRQTGCTFDAFLDDFNLHGPALDKMADVIRAADTDRNDLVPQAAWLLALSVGLSRLYRDDAAQLEAGMLLYDALFRWARDGQDETHGWPEGRA